MRNNYVVYDIIQRNNLNTIIITRFPVTRSPYYVNTLTSIHSVPYKRRCRYLPMDCRAEVKYYHFRRGTIGICAQIIYIIYYYNGARFERACDVYYLLSHSGGEENRRRCIIYRTAAHVTSQCYNMYTRETEAKSDGEPTE